MSDLLPCPFCGGNAGFQAIQGNNPRPFAWDVIHSCAVGGGSGWIRISPRDANGRGTKSMAADAWNTRADLPRPQDAARIAELVAALSRIATPAPGVTEPAPPWAVGIARAALAADSGAAE